MPWNPYEPFFADQGIYHIIWKYHQELFEHLALRWDVTKCRHAYGITLGTHNAPDSKGRVDGEDVTEETQAERQYWHEESGEGFIAPGILHL